MLDIITTIYPYIEKVEFFYPDYVNSPGFDLQPIHIRLIKKILFIYYEELMEQISGLSKFFELVDENNNDIVPRKVKINDYNKPKDLTANSLHLLFTKLKDYNFFNNAITNQTIAQSFQNLTGYSGSQLNKVIGAKEIETEISTVKDYELLIFKLKSVLSDLEKKKEKLK